MTSKDIAIIAGPLVSICVIMAVVNSKRADNKTKWVFTLLANFIFIGSVAYYGFSRADLAMFLLTFGLLDFVTIKRIRMGNDINEKLYEQWNKDPKNWKLWLFYYNPRDKRVFPEARFESLGWTINFANADSVLLMMTIIVLIVLIMNALPFFNPTIIP